MSASSYVSRLPFLQQIFLSSAGAAANSGLNPDSPKPFADGNLWAIPANTLITGVYVIVDVAITGTTDMDIGDADDPDGFVDGTNGLASGLGTVGVYSYDAKAAGAYLRVQTAGATDAADIYVVRQAKYYSASGKYVALDITTTNTAGKARVIVEGVMLGAFGG